MKQSTPLSHLYGSIKLAECVVRTVSNWWETILYLYGLTDKAKVKFKGPLQLIVNEKDRPIVKNLIELAAYGVEFTEKSSYIDNGAVYWKVDWKNRIIEIPPGIKFTLDSVKPLVFAETFLFDVHFVGFDLTNKIILDIGAFVGDTALYYASKGAIVYAFEPNPINYFLMRKNIDLNPQFKSQIICSNKAVGLDKKNVIMRWNHDVDESGTVSFRYPSRFEAMVEEVSLKTILTEYNLPSKLFLLKLDCKGCEMDLVLQDEIGLFDVVLIEYDYAYLPYNHELFYSYVRFLIESLKRKGFQRFRIFKHNMVTGSILRNGTLLASK